MASVGGGKNGVVATYGNRAPRAIGTLANVVQFPTESLKPLTENFGSHVTPMQ